MKNTLEEVRELYVGLLMDLQLMHPTIAAMLMRDFSRLREQSIVQGLPFYTITLPAISKWLESSLSTGCLKDPRPHLCSRLSRVDQRPQTLWSLFSLVFESDGTLRSDLDVSAISSIRQVCLLAKKLRVECKPKYVENSINDFRDIEKCLPSSWPDTWDSDYPLWSPRCGHPIWGVPTEESRQPLLFDVDPAMLQLDYDPDWEGLRRLSARFLHQLGEFDPFAVRPKHGPGAVSDKHSDFVKNDFKYWSARLESVFPYDFHASSRFHVPEYVVFREFPSQLYAVPKTQSGPRLIAAEPTSHQWIQGGIQKWLEESINKTFLKDSIDFRSQETSKSLALRASYDQSFATVDLSSASDRLTTRLVEYIFQGNRYLLDALHACRTRVLHISDGEHVLLRKFSTQGSALTFPIQTVVYSILSLWALAITRNVKDYEGIVALAPSVRVFGDDIIIPTDAYPVLKSLFETCLLKVNANKSHASGFFREACGMDAYAGVDVTPAYYREEYSSSPTSLNSVIECSNNFHLKGYWNTAEALLKTVPESERKLLPFGQVDFSTPYLEVKTPRSGDPDTDASGGRALKLLTFSGQSFQHLRSRWNADLHRTEYLVIDVTAKVPLRQGQGEGGLVQFFHSYPSLDDEVTKNRAPPEFYSSGQPSTPLLRKRKRWVPE